MSGKRMENRKCSDRRFLDIEDDDNDGGDGRNQSK